MYSYTIILLRFLGKRGMGQLSTLETAIIISFGSAVGDPMVDENSPIIYGIVAITAVAFFQIGLERLINKNKKVEAFMEGEARVMVDNGVIQWKCMTNENLSKEDLFRSLRDREVEHLGQISKALFEISGVVSVMFYPPKKVKPGLTVLPETTIPKNAVLKSEEHVSEEAFYSCFNCGNTRFKKEKDKLYKCEVCSTTEWIKSVV